jgi:hypothetical protein
MKIEYHYFYSFNGLATGERRALFRFDGVGENYNIRN